MKIEKQYDETQSPLKMKHLVRLFGLCQKTYFTFAGTTCEKIKGISMGSPISGLKADLVLQELENIAFIQQPPIFWHR
ncbi:unnamed protein product [Dibothriocephalus latus]|uniref:Reverse transcriptase domain-containing protein n=1 Tax=Dibothriocephalus latus TaxID=60516 RepID=A0A3P6SUN8_DIBLA|nr:unnamed protein product [Dibothriocephalus latus]